MTEQPKVSVIMGIYNCENTLPQAVDSILAQTYPNWELVMCDDGSTDGTYAVAEEYRKTNPEKIILLKNDRNRKLSYTLNRCLEAATGELIARMDGDDMSHADRLQRQVDYLCSHPEIQLVGTQMHSFDENGFHGIMRPPAHPCVKDLISDTSFYHATILTYRYVYDAIGGYCLEKRAERVEDIDLWFRFYANRYAGVNLDEPLYDVRVDFDTIRRRTLQARIHSIETRAAGYKLVGFPRYWLIKPGFILFVKGLVPPRITALLRKARAKRRNLI